MWWQNKPVVVPNVPGLRRDILSELHGPPAYGHPGTGKMLNAVQRLYWWHGFHTDVRNFVKSCDGCQRNKASTQAPSGLVQPLPIPHHKREDLSMDFITGLPETKPLPHMEHGYDAIFVVVDRLTKMVHIAPTYGDITAEQTAHLAMNTVFKHHGTPRLIVTDRQQIFIGTFLA
jgi:hypothetical protein